MLRKVASPAGFAGMLCSMRPPNFKKALQVCPAARAVAVHTLGRRGQNGFDLCILRQVLQGTGTNSKPAHMEFGSTISWLHILFITCQQ